MSKKVTPPDSAPSKSQAEQTVRHCYSTWGKTYFDEYYGANAPYPPIHREIIKRLVIESRSRNLLDAGCGPASILRAFADTNVDLFGFDLTPEMALEAKKVMAGIGFPGDRIWLGSVTDPAAFRAPAGSPAGGFDAVACVGVLPHIPEDQEERVLANLYNAVRPGGLVVIEARNALFSLFTLNRYSWEFFESSLIDFPALERSGRISPDTLSAARTELQARFRMDMPPTRRGKKDEPGYDEILSRNHNPFLLARRFAEAGFASVRTLFYHFHRLPPMIEGSIGPAFRKLGVEMEDPHDWRGHFMASAFLLAGVRS